MANLTITTITRPKLPRNKYGIINSGTISGNTVIINSSGSGGGEGQTYYPFTGASSFSDGSAGLVPKPYRGQQNYVLHGNGTFRQLYDGHLIYNSETGTFVFDSSISGTKAVFTDISTGTIKSSSINTSALNVSTGNFKYINGSTGKIDDLSTRVADIRILNSSTGYIKTLNSSTINSSVINGSTGNIQTINSSTIDTSVIKAKDGSIYELVSENITTHNLEVTGFAHFYELLIDKIKSVGGSVILTPADGFVVEKVIDSGSGYKLYWSASDDEKAISNMWEYHDQAICMTFNNAQVGMNYDISNKYYWSLVISTGTETIDGNDYHYIEISKTVKDGTVNPEPGDEIVMLGSRNTQDLNRQNAIYISAYDGLDSTLYAPFICQYKGINDFNLSNHKYTWFAANGNNIRGSLKVESGDSIEDLLFEIDASLNQISSTVQGNTQAINNLQNQEIGARNYVRNTSDQWSDWIPFRNVNNQTVALGNCYLPAEKNVGDYYTSQITVQFSSVEETHDGTFRIATQASMDDSWSTPNFWNSQLMNITAEPEDNVFTFVHTYQVQEANKDSVLMKPSIRIDYAMGSFRYKCVKVEKGNVATDWTPAPEDFENSITTITNNMSNITQTMNQISSTVSSHTTHFGILDSSVNSLNSSIISMSSEISTIDQKADSITTKVDNLFIETLFNNKINSGLFFTLSDGESAQSITWNSTEKSYKMVCNSSTADIDYSNDESLNDYRIDKGIYQLSFDIKCSHKNVRYFVKLELYKNNSLVLEKTVISETESAYFNDDIIVETFEVPSDDCRFKLYVESNYNVTLPSTTWYVTISNLKVVMQTRASSVIMQKADSITSTVYETQRDVQGLQLDVNNKFGTSSYDGGEISSGNRWLFVDNGLNYDFYNWITYGTVFKNGGTGWETRATGETWIYSPYIYLTAGSSYTLNCYYTYDAGSNNIQLVRFANANDAKTLNSPTDTITIGTNYNLDNETDVVYFTIPSGKSGYFRLKFSNIVSDFDENESYVVELERVRLYNELKNIDEIPKWSMTNANSYSQIQQTGHSIELKVYDELTATGIDIESRQITVTTDNFTINNNNNEQVLGTDSDGNLEVTGTIRANSLYHGITIFIDGGTYKNKDNVNYYYCDDLSYMEDEDSLEGWSDHNNFQEGKYYEWPNEKAPHYGTPPNGFIECSYSSDIIWLMSRANATTWRYNTAVCLPKASDFPGKIVQIYGSRSVTSTGTGVSIKVGSVASNDFSLGIYADTTAQSFSNVSISDTITINPQTDITFISFDNKWIVMDYKTKTLL